MTEEMAGRSEDRFEVAVIGAGQAGLAMGYFLAREGRHFTILEAAGSIGAAWRTRWDSLVLFTPRRYDSLPGLPFPGDPDGYPGATRSSATSSATPRPLSCQSSSTALCRRSHAQTGASSSPLEHGLLRRSGCGCDRSIPGPERAFVRSGSRAGHRPDAQHGLSACERCSPRNGFGRRRWQHRIQIAEELSATHSVHLAVGSRQTPLPQRVFGRDVFWWLTERDSSTRRSTRASDSLHNVVKRFRLESASREAPWRRDQAASRGRFGPYGDLRGWKRTRGRCRHLGNRLPIRFRLD